MPRLRSRLLRPAIHAIIISLIFFVAYKLRLVTDLIPGIQLKIPPINGNELIIFAVISAATFIFIGIIKKLYELHKPTQKYFQTFSKVRVYWFITITFIAYFGQSFVFKWGISRFIIILTCFLTYFVIFFFDQIRNYIEAKKLRNAKQKILIVTNDITNSYEAVQKVKKAFAFKSELIQIEEIDDINVAKYHILIAVGNFEKKILQDMFEKIRLSETRFFHISEGYFLEDVVYTPENIDNIIALEYKHSKLDGRSIIFKRIFDTLLAIIFTVITLPFMFTIAIAIKINSKWPIFYYQKRVWKNEKIFTFIKFRTMFTKDCIGENYGGTKARNKRQKLINSDANIRKWELQKIHNDPRITKIGKLLRKTSLDELPNLFSVIIGKMSLVGPRPHMPHEIKKYKHRQKRVLSIKPGVTGYAQIFGRDNLSFDDEARLDLYYIQHRSLFLDFYIIFGTLGVVFKGK